MSVKDKVYDEISAKKSCDAVNVLQAEMLDDSQLSEVSGGKNVFEKGLDFVSSKKVQKALNVRNTLFAEQFTRIIDKKKDKE